MKVTAKELLLKIKALFADTTDIAPASTTDATVFSYPVDGGGMVYVDCSDDGVADIDVNDKVFTDPALTIPYAPGTYKVTGTDFGFTVASGVVSAVTDTAGTGPGVPLEQADPTTTDLGKTPGAAPAKPAAPGKPAIPTTPEGMRALYEAFATGTPEDRLANLELVARALMEYSFGWQIREAQQKATTDQAITIYKQDLTTAQAAMKKQEAQLKAIFELVEKVVELPSADPKTLTGNKKEKFDAAKAGEEDMEHMAEELRKKRNGK